MDSQAIGLYLHIPFCLRKCAYCDFVSYPQPGHLPAAVEGLLAEMALQANRWGRLPVRTVFLGGGTPSLLSGDQAGRLLEGICCHFDLDPRAEITLEANPGTVTLEKLRAYREAGINRLSIGAQATQDDLLEVIGRIHRWADVVFAVDMARQAGFEQLSLDLMYGLPGQSPAQWAESLDKALALGPTHLSCYELILEEGTPLAQSQPILPSEEDVLAMDSLTLEKTAAYGMARYEISNYALPGQQCQHNLIYWRRQPYLGLGPGAHSFLNGERFANTPELTPWLEGIRKGVPALEQWDSISPAEARFETMMLGLRCTEGIRLADFDQAHGLTPWACWPKTLETLREQGLLQWDEERLWLTPQGLALQNTVLVALDGAKETDRGALSHISPGE